MTENAANPNLNETDLRELAFRLTTSPDDPRTQHAHLFPSQLPDQLPVTLPFPEDSRILGSLVRNPESITMLLDVPLSPEHILAFYRERMQAAGWQRAEIDPLHRRGFLSSEEAQSPGGNETYYLPYNPTLPTNVGERVLAWDEENRVGPALTVNAFPGKDNGTDLRLHLEMNSPFPIAPGTHNQENPARRILNLPTVEAPEGTKQRRGIRRGNFHLASSEVILETMMDLSALAAHYTTQLKQAGCVLIEEGQKGPLAWNSWTLKEDNASGFFMILNMREHEYYLMMRMWRN